MKECCGQTMNRASAIELCSNCGTPLGMTDSAAQPDIDFYVSRDTPAELLRITPSHKFIFVGDAGKDIGYLSWEDGQLSFSGDAEESAKAFFQFLKPYVDEYIARAMAKK